MVFEEELAEVYDLIYRDKNYEVECDFIEEIFQKHSKMHIKSILDAGCGSGGHAIPLTKRGYDVVGFDLSDVMIESAKKKAEKEKITNLDLHVMDLRDFQIDDKFDACIAMFAVIGYMTKNSDIIKALNNIRKHLKPDGIFVFDIWNGLTVMRILPEERVKEVENEKVKVIRFAVPALRSFDHICEVNYKVLILNKEKNSFNEINEKHVVRFHFPQEIRYYLENAGFEVLNICPFLGLNGKVDENVWNIAVVAKAIGEGE
ncbi:MAG: class I SAM-dependent methyltransferase [Thermoplasmatales archaeon]|nr:class I SAM-dependent methyltransferase [Thermoplasmatales archaeon]